MVSMKRFYGTALLILLCAYVSVSFGQIGAPRNLTVYSDGGEISLRWDAVPGAIGYNIYKDTNPSVDMSFPYDVSATNSYTDELQSGLKYFYAVTANVPAGCVTGTVTDTSGAGVANVWVSGVMQSDTTVTFHAKTLADGSYSACDLTVGTYAVSVCREYFPVLQSVVSVTEGQSATWNPTWSPFAWTQVGGHITGNDHWTNDHVYQMTVYTWVDNGATLTIDCGTTIVGNYPTLSMLVVSVGGQAFMNGTKYCPIVFTSNRPIGQRRSGDWGGVTIDGRAHENRTNGQGTFPVVPMGEGDTGPAGRPDTLFDSESSGVYRYARLEFAGYRFNDVNELNGWAMYGVGRGTVVQYVESTCGKDDQMEFFGGSFNMDHFVSHNTGDDGFDWTDGWNGHVQYVVMSVRGPESGHGIEADNYENGYDFLPRSNPTLANFTIISSLGNPETGNDDNTAVMLRRGTLANMHNFVVTKGRISGVDLVDSSTAWQASRWASADDSINNRYWLRVPSGRMVMDNTIFWDNGQAATQVIDPTTPAGIGDGHFYLDDAEYDEANCRGNQRMCINTVGLFAPVGWTQDITNFRGCGAVGANATNHVVDPMLIAPIATGNAYDPRPQAGSPCLNPANAASPAVMQSLGFQYAPYVGAFSGPTDNWMEGWTAFPDFYEQ